MDASRKCEEGESRTGNRNLITSEQQRYRIKEGGLWRPPSFMLALAEAGFGESDRYGGRLIRWRDGESTVVASGPVSPTAVAVMSGRI